MLSPCLLSNVCVISCKILNVRGRNPKNARGQGPGRACVGKQHAPRHIMRAISD